ncbi:hypothetical protein [Curtobacterium sp. MCBA15_004]|uniref:hypothetical protein n=1 Tax=Curtobacterium sp. MCBA15_004 TaxID=1898733 RepID=UPI0008DCBA98|nr:hypothetical protein [Curtobacterium sp. MCBA15_004]WIA98030.1 hypothetical protein QOL16_06485 [Curtobacterium sp. MCBA15_004]
MAQITTQPILMNAAVLLLGTDNYELTVSSAELAPTTPMQQFKGVGGSVVPIVGTPSWLLNLAYAQDFATAKSLATYLLQNAGKVVPFTLRPVSGGPGYSGNVMCLPGSIGGAVDAIASSSVSLPVSGQPTAAAAA